MTESRDIVERLIRFHGDPAHLEAATEITTLRQRVKGLEEALREIDAGIFIDNGDVTCLPVYAVRDIIARALGTKP